MDPIKEILEAMERVEEWQCDKYLLLHKPSGTVFWIANGYSHFRVEVGPSLSLGSWARWKLWRRAKKLRLRLMANLLKTEKQEHSAGAWR